MEMVCLGLHKNLMFKRTLLNMMREDRNHVRTFDSDLLLLFQVPFCKSYPSACASTNGVIPVLAYCQRYDNYDIT